MKTKSIPMQQPSIKQIQMKIAFLLILFFVLFGAASLYLLLNSPA